MPLTIQQYKTALFQCSRGILGDTLATAFSKQLTENVPRLFTDQLHVWRIIDKYRTMADIQQIMQDAVLDSFKEKFPVEGETLHTHFKQLLIEQYGSGGFNTIELLVDRALDKIETTFNVNYLLVNKLKIILGDMSAQRSDILNSEIANIEENFFDLIVDDKVTFALAKVTFENIVAELQSVITHSAQSLVNKYRMVEKLLNRVDQVIQDRYRGLLTSDAVVKKITAANRKILLNYEKMIRRTIQDTITIWQQGLLPGVLHYINVESEIADFIRSRVLWLKVRKLNVMAQRFINTDSVEIDKAFEDSFEKIFYDDLDDILHCISHGAMPVEKPTAAKLILSKPVGTKISSGLYSGVRTESSSADAHLLLQRFKFADVDGAVIAVAESINCYLKDNVKSIILQLAIEKFLELLNSPNLKLCELKFLQLLPLVASFPSEHRISVMQRVLKLAPPNVIISQAHIDRCLSTEDDELTELLIRFKQGQAIRTKQLILDIVRHDKNSITANGYNKLIFLVLALDEPNTSLLLGYLLNEVPLEIENIGILMEKASSVSNQAFQCVFNYCVENGIDRVKPFYRPSMSMSQYIAQLLCEALEHEDNQRAGHIVSTVGFNMNDHKDQLMNHLLRFKKHSQIKWLVSHGLNLTMSPRMMRAPNAAFFQTTQSQSQLEHTSNSNSENPENKSRVN